MQPATPSRSLSFARMVAREGYPVMTFAEFQATGHDVADLANEFAVSEGYINE